MSKSILLLFSLVFWASVSEAQKKLVCYHTNWSQYRQEPGKFFPENIDANLCTHIIYSFAKVSGDTLAPYEWNDLDQPWSKGMYSRTLALKSQNPSLKILIAVGGWNHGAAPFSNMVSNAATRANFVRNSLDFVRKNGFDGLDLDWEYPGSNGGVATDKALFTALVKELKAAYAPAGMLLTAAVGAGKKTIDAGYEIDKISQDLDFINIMAYDYHGSWESFTGHNAPLYARENEVGDQALLNVDFTVDYWLQKGAPSEKIVLGMGTYGRSFRISGGNNPGDRASGGAPGPYTGEGGFMSYYEVCQKLSQGWTRKYDEEALVPYAYSGSDWVGYDDQQSLKEKVDYIKLKGLGGGMFWALDLDDFSGQFCGQGRYPLINSVKSQLNNGVMPQSTTRKVKSTTGAATTTTPTKVSTTTGATTDLSKCTNGDGYYQDTRSGCKNYFICAFTNTLKPIIKIMSCPEGLLFDPSIKGCNKAESVKCNGDSVGVVTTTAGSSTTTVKTTIKTTTRETTTTTTTDIPVTGNGVCAKGDGYYADEASGCHEYIFCVFSNTPYSKSFRYACAGSLKFDAKLKACTKDVECNEKKTTTSKTPTSTTTPKAPSSTSILSTIIPTTTKAAVITDVKCSNGDGVYADLASNCAQYIECVFQGTEHARTVLYSCPEGTRFDAGAKQCLWADEAKCY